MSIVHVTDYNITAPNFLIIAEGNTVHTIYCNWPNRVPEIYKHLIILVLENPKCLTKRESEKREVEELCAHNYPAIELLTHLRRLCSAESFPIFGPRFFGLYLPATTAHTHSEDRDRRIVQERRHTGSETENQLLL